MSVTADVIPTELTTLCPRCSQQHQLFQDASSGLSRFYFYECNGQRFICKDKKPSDAKTIPQIFIEPVIETKAPDISRSEEPERPKLTKRRTTGLIVAAIPKKMGRPLHSVDLETAVTLYKELGSVRKVAKAMGLHYNTLQRRMNIAGVFDILQAEESSAREDAFLNQLKQAARQTIHKLAASELINPQKRTLALIELEGEIGDFIRSSMATGSAK